VPVRALFVPKVAGLVTILAVFGAVIGTESATIGTVIVSQSDWCDMQGVSQPAVCDTPRLSHTAGCDIVSVSRRERATAQECRTDIQRYSQYVAAEPCDTTVVSQSTATLSS